MQVEISLEAARGCGFRREWQEAHEAMIRAEERAVRAAEVVDG